MTLTNMSLKNRPEGLAVLTWVWVRAGKSDLDNCVHIKGQILRP